MGILHPGGSAGSTSSQSEPTDPGEVNRPLEGGVESTEEPVGIPETDIADAPHVKDSMVTKSSFDTDRASDTHRMIAAYADGYTLKCTYYHSLESTTGRSTTYTDPGHQGSHSTHTEFLKIRAMEFKVLDDMDFSYDTDSNISSYVGEGVFYPGFAPRVGDVFVYSIEPGVTILFRITDLSRLSMYKHTYYRVMFTFDEILTDETIARLERSVVDIAYFDRQAFLNGEISLIKSQDYVRLNRCKRIRKELLTYYSQTFFDSARGTYMHPDGYYDPYLVEYLLSKISSTDTSVRSPKQIYPDVLDYEHSFWWGFTDPYMNDLQASWRYCQVVHHTKYVWSAYITTLTGKNVLILRDEKSDSEDCKDYVFKDLFYDTDADSESERDESDFQTVTPAMAIFFQPLTPSEMAAAMNKVDDPILLEIAYSFKYKRVDNIAEILRVATGYRSMSKEYVFYMIPVLVHLIDLAIYGYRR